MALGRSWRYRTFQKKFSAKRRCRTIAKFDPIPGAQVPGLFDEIFIHGLGGRSIERCAFHPLDKRFFDVARLRLRNLDDVCPGLFAVDACLVFRILSGGRLRSSKKKSQQPLESRLDGGPLAPPPDDL
jgi:hypothetical protein